MGLKAKRKAAGLTQQQAADLFGIKYRTYQNYENNVTTPDMDTAAKFARYFHCTIGELFDLKEGMNDQNELLDIFNQMNTDGRDVLLVIARGLADLFPM